MMQPTSTIYCSRCRIENVAQAQFCRRCRHALQMRVSSKMETERASVQPLLNQRYRFVQLLGKGGMGAVYKAEDLKFQRRSVAIKEMHQSNLAFQEVERVTRMFEQEAQLLANLQHPNLPSIYDYFNENGRWYLVMDFIEGTTLHKQLEQAPGKVLSLQQTLNIGIQLAKVLGYLHNRPTPIVFRDLKPLNIMITPDDNIYLIDFGIARFFKPGQAKDTVSYISSGYAAPEQYGTAQTSPLSDIYSLGATLHQMLSGHKPSDSPFAFKPLQAYNPQLPTMLTELVAKMVDIEPTQRPTSTAIVRQTLEQVQMLPKQVDRLTYSPPPLIDHPALIKPSSQRPSGNNQIQQSAQIAKPALPKSRAGNVLLTGTIMGLLCCTVTTLLNSANDFMAIFMSLVINAIIIGLFALIAGLFIGKVAVQRRTGFFVGCTISIINMLVFTILTAYTMINVIHFQNGVNSSSNTNASTSAYTLTGFYILAYILIFICFVIWGGLIGQLGARLATINHPYYKKP